MNHKLLFLSLNFYLQKIPYITSRYEVGRKNWVTICLILQYVLFFENVRLKSRYFIDERFINFYYHLCNYVDCLSVCDTLGVFVANLSISQASVNAAGLGIVSLGAVFSKCELIQLSENACP